MLQKRYYQTGDKFALRHISSSRPTDTYLLCCTLKGSIALVSLTRGNRFVEAVSCDNPLSAIPAEIVASCAPDCELTLL